MSTCNATGVWESNAARSTKSGGCCLSRWCWQDEADYLLRVLETRKNIRSQHHLGNTLPSFRLLQPGSPWLWGEPGKSLQRDEPAASHGAGRSDASSNAASGRGPAGAVERLLGRCLRCHLKKPTGSDGCVESGLENVIIIWNVIIFWKRIAYLFAQICIALLLYIWWKLYGRWFPLQSCRWK